MTIATPDQSGTGIRKRIDVGFAFDAILKAHSFPQSTTLLMTSHFNYFVFALSTALILLTPGPTNTLLAVAGLERGAKGALPLIACELLGYVIAISVWGCILTPFQNNYPWLAILVRAASSFYLIWMAVKVWRAAVILPSLRREAISPKALLIATILNPKALLFSSLIFPAIAINNIQVYLAAMVLFSCLVVPIGLAWTMFGAILNNGRLTVASRVKLQRATAMILGAFSASIAWAAFH
jgi:threonine/homoserine/homoserine lactone efflux protein